jgi:serpin B
MKHLLLAVLASLLILAGSCKKDPAGPKQPKPIYLPQKAGEVIAANNGFGVDLFRLTTADEPGNIMISPLSASTALTMLLNGCKTQTYEQIRDMLGYNGLTLDEINQTYESLVSQLLAVDPEVQLSLANAIFYREDFVVKPEFLQVMDSSFGAQITALDFYGPSALDIINKWASDNTNGKIQTVMDEMPPGMVMFLMNALYFKGSWTYQFNEAQTSQILFHPAIGNAVNVAMMRNILPVKMYSGNGAIVIELPYGRQNFAMDIIIPDNTLDEYLPGFDNAKWSLITSGLDALTEPDEAEIIMPKFKFEFEKLLNDQLKALGMLDAFAYELADLSGIADAEIFVDFVKQNTFVDVNEEGTEAAAVTAIGIKEVSMPPSILIDRPFIFAIRERTTNTLLFIGKVENPEY